MDESKNTQSSAYPLPTKWPSWAISGQTRSKRERKHITPAPASYEENDHLPLPLSGHTRTKAGNKASSHRLPLKNKITTLHGLFIAVHGLRKSRKPLRRLPLTNKTVFLAVPLLWLAIITTNLSLASRPYSDVIRYWHVITHQTHVQSRRHVDQGSSKYVSRPSPASRKDWVATSSQIDRWVPDGERYTAH